MESRFPSPTKVCKLPPPIDSGHFKDNMHLHQSLPSPYPKRLLTSGAKYARVPDLLVKGLPGVKSDATF